MGQFLDAAEIVLTRTQRPMPVRELTHAALELGLLDFTNGKTPHQTMKAKLSVNIRSLGTRSRFKRAGKGLFALRKLDVQEYMAQPIQKVIKPSEDVLVFPVQLLDKLKRFHGINPNYQPYAMTLLDPQNTQFLPRIDAETNIAYKQVLSYVIVRSGNTVLRFVRGKYTSAHTFLKGRYCIAFGGHVQSRDMQDTPLFSYSDSGYTNSIHRELNEELRLPSNAITDKSLQLVGVLNDDSSDLGKIHFAFVHLLNLDHLHELTPAKALKREKSINQLEFVPIQQLGDEFERYEYWSKLCIQTFFRKEVRIPCRIRPLRRSSFRRHRDHIAIVGCLGSGKTEACRLLQRDYGYHLIPTGRLLQEILRTPPIQHLGRRTFSDAALSFITSSRGPKTLADAIYQHISAAKGHRCAIDGIRNLKTFELLRKQLDGDLTLIYVDSTVDNAYTFFKQREGRGLSFAEFLQLLHHPVEREVPQFIQMADIVFYNHGGKSSYLDTIRHYFEEHL